MEDRFVRSMVRTARIVQVAKWILGIAAVLLGLIFFAAMFEWQYRLDQDCAKAGGAMVHGACVPVIRLR